MVIPGQWTESGYFEVKDHSGLGPGAKKLKDKALLHLKSDIDSGGIPPCGR